MVTPNWPFNLKCMKVLVFAHTPPPHHGQSYMVQLMLDGFGGDQRKQGRTSRTNYEGPDFPSLKPTRAGDFGIACYHVNARLSSNLEDIGAVRPGKFFLLFGYCLQAIWCRFRYGINTFTTCPRPANKRPCIVTGWSCFSADRFSKKLFCIGTQPEWRSGWRRRRRCEHVR